MKPAHQCILTSVSASDSELRFLFLVGLASAFICFCTFFRLLSDLQWYLTLWSLLTSNNENKCWHKSEHTNWSNNLNGCCKVFSMNSPRKVHDNINLWHCPRHANTCTEGKRYIFTDRNTDTPTTNNNNNNKRSLSRLKHVLNVKHVLTVYIHMHPHSQPLKYTLCTCVWDSETGHTGPDLCSRAPDTWWSHQRGCCSRPCPGPPHCPTWEQVPGTLQAVSAPDLCLRRLSPCLSPPGSFSPPLSCLCDEWKKFNVLSVTTGLACHGHGVKTEYMT